MPIYSFQHYGYFFNQFLNELSNDICNGLDFGWLFIETLLDSKPKLMCRHAGVADLSFSNSKDENMVVDRI